MTYPSNLPVFCLQEEVHVSRLIHQMESCYRNELKDGRSIEEKQDSAAKNQSSDKATEYAT